MEREGRLPPPRTALDMERILRRWRWNSDDNRRHSALSRTERPCAMSRQALLSLDGTDALQRKAQALGLFPPRRSRRRVQAWAGAGPYAIPLRPPFGPERLGARHREEDSPQAFVRGDPSWH